MSEREQAAIIRYYRRILAENAEQIEGCMVQARLGRKWGEPDRTRNNIAVARSVNRESVRVRRYLRQLESD